MKTAPTARSPRERPAGDDGRFEAVVKAFAANPRLRHVAAAFAAEKAIGSRRKFGSRALKVNGKIFATVVDGRLVVKLPGERVSALIRSREGAPFESGGGRVMKQWVVILGEKVSWIRVATEAHDFVLGIRH